MSYLPSLLFKKRFIVFLCLLPLLTCSQEIFQKKISHSNTLSINDLIQLPDHGYFGCGSIDASSPDSGYAVVVKFDSLMQVQWCKGINMRERDYFRCLTSLSDGNWLVGGTSKEDFSDFYGGNLYKIDDTGNILWHRIYSDSKDDLTLGVFEQTDQTLTVIIRYGVTGQPTKVLKTDLAGNLLGEFTLSTSNSFPGVVGDCVASDGLGNYFIAGQTINSTTGKYVFYICKTTNNAPIWYCEYDYARNSAFLYDIVLLSDGNIAVTGKIADEILTSINTIAVMKIDPGSGAVIWNREIKQEADYNQAGYRILTLENGEMIVCGQANTENGLHAFATKLYADGSVDWAKHYGDGPYNSFWLASEVESDRFLFAGFAALNEGPYIVQTDQTGHSPCNTDALQLTAYDIPATLYYQDIITGDPNVEVLEPAYEEMIFSLSENILCSGSVAVVEIPGGTKGLKIYPNPASNSISVELNDRTTTRYQIEIFNIYGAIVYSCVMQNQKKVIETPFSPGVYFITIASFDNQTYYQQEFIIF